MNTMDKKRIGEGEKQNFSGSLPKDRENKA